MNIKDLPEALHRLSEAHKNNPLARIKDCPFSEIPIACDWADCRGCQVLIEAQEAEAQHLWEGWKEEQRHIASGAYDNSREK